MLSTFGISASLVQFLQTVWKPDATEGYAEKIAEIIKNKLS